MTTIISKYHQFAPGTGRKYGMSDPDFEMDFHRCLQDIMEFNNLTSAELTPHLEEIRKYYLATWEALTSGTKGDFK
jgi:hypothetical protein